MSREEHSIPCSNSATDRLSGDPAVSFWSKRSLSSAPTRDSVDAANTAEMLFRLIDDWRRELLKLQTGQSGFAKPLRRREQTKCASPKAFRGSAGKVILR
jgi:hypothetical protein